VSDKEWFKNATCKGQPAEIFFILREDKNQRVKRQQAYAFCKICDVSKECLDYAIINREIGIWGGTSDRDRRKLRRNWIKLSNPRLRPRGYKPYV